MKVILPPSADIDKRTGFFDRSRLMVGSKSKPGGLTEGTLGV